MTESEAPSPVDVVVQRFAWSREPIERAVEAFGRDRVSRALIALDHRGGLADFEREMAQRLALLLGQKLLLPEGATSDERIFEPKSPSATA
jgi:hypothetical protein